MNKLVQAWYRGSPWLTILKPLAALFRHQAGRRREAYQKGIKESWRAPVPVLVVGNISVGGVGKTPLVAWLARSLSERAYKPGIVSRGYGSQAPHYPFAVTADGDSQECGDEPLMLARATNCPVVIDSDRAAAANYLLDNNNCDLIISDDGMQHYALQRDIEIAVVDGRRGLGNGLCLPAGPLREPPERLASVDFLVVNGEGFNAERESYQMQLKPKRLVNLSDQKLLAAEELADQGAVHAVAGIGNPERFFTTLKSLGYRLIEHPFPDHYPFKADDLRFNDDLAVIMTEKDAVKCAAFAHDRCWYLRVEAELPPRFIDELIEKLTTLTQSA